MHIKDAMQAKQISIDTVSVVLGIHRNTASNKLSGETQFTMQEGFVLKKILFPEYDMEYLFQPELLANLESTIDDNTASREAS